MDLATIMKTIDAGIEIFKQLTDKVKEAQVVATSGDDLAALQQRVDQLHAMSEELGAELDTALEAAKTK